MRVAMERVVCVSRDIVQLTRNKLQTDIILQLWPLAEMLYAKMEHISLVRNTLTILRRRAVAS